MNKGGSVLQIFGLAGLVVAGALTGIQTLIAAVAVVSIYVGIAVER